MWRLRQLAETSAVLSPGKKEKVANSKAQAAEGATAHINLKEKKELESLPHA